MFIFDQILRPMIRVGVIGAGHLGKIHLKLLAENPKYDLIGFFDTNTETSEVLATNKGYRYYSSIDELLGQIDAACIVTPTPFHFEVAQKAINHGVHLLIEKPITTSVNQAYQLVKDAREKNLIGVVGHVERFNPAYSAAASYINEPKFIEIHRLAEFNPRGNDVSVILDLMIHDIDILLQMVKSKITSIDANGAAVVSSSPDIASARIAFENGCVANLTASRISLKNMRRTRLFQKDAYITIDFLAKKTEVVRIKEAPENPEPFDMILQTAEGDKKQIYFESPETTEVNAIAEEHNDFALAIEGSKEPNVSFEHGAKALEVAQAIIDKLEF